MTTLILQCGSCGTALSLDAPASPDVAFSCETCGKKTEARLFPALLRPVARGAAGEKILLDDDSACFYHAGKKAVIPCAHCGRFLCALCDVDLGSGHYCPSCIDSGVRQEKMDDLKTNYVLYDELALTVAVLPFLIGIWPALFGAPAALYIAVRYWKHPLSIVPRSRWRFVLAALLALSEIVFFVVIALFVAEDGF